MPGIKSGIRARSRRTEPRLTSCSICLRTHCRAPDRRHEACSVIGGPERPTTGQGPWFPYEEKNENRNAARTHLAWHDLCCVWVKRILALHPGNLAVGTRRPVPDCTHSVALRTLYRRCSGCRGGAPACEPLRSAGARPAWTSDREHPAISPAFGPRGAALAILVAIFWGVLAFRHRQS